MSGYQNAAVIQANLLCPSSAFPSLTGTAAKAGTFNPKVTVNKSKQELESARAFQPNNTTAMTGSSAPPANRPATPASGSNK